jgi:Zn-dependent M16 (insulinase) family peptidase
MEVPAYSQIGIRGAGLAYHTQVIVNEELGCLTFRVWSSPNAVKAIVAARDIVAGLARGEVRVN